MFHACRKTKLLNSFQLKSVCNILMVSFLVSFFLFLSCTDSGLGTAPPQSSDSEASIYYLSREAGTEDLVRPVARYSFDSTEVFLSGRVTTGGLPSSVERIQSYHKTRNSITTLELDSSGSLFLYTVDSSTGIPSVIIEATSAEMDSIDVRLWHPTTFELLLRDVIPLQNSSRLPKKFAGTYVHAGSDWLDDEFNAFRDSINKQLKRAKGTLDWIETLAKQFNNRAGNKLANKLVDHAEDEAEESIDSVIAASEAVGQATAGDDIDVPEEPLLSKLQKRLETETRIIYDSIISNL